MTTIRDIIARAYRKIGVAAVDMELTADQVAHGLDAFNAMVHGWKLRGVDLAHSDVAATDAFPLGPEYVEGTVYLLAARLSPDYMVPPSFDADDWFRTFQAHNTTAAPVTMPVDLRIGLANSRVGRKAII